MRDLQENIVVLDAIRAASVGIGVTVDARANGVLQAAGVIDLADYNYPRKMLICVSVGTVAANGTLLVHVESGDTAAGVATNTDHAFALIIVEGDVLYEYTPTRRYINIEAAVAVAAIEFSVTLVMEHNRYGSVSGLVT